MVRRRSEIINVYQIGTAVFEQRRWTTTLLTTHLQCRKFMKNWHSSRNKRRILDFLDHADATNSKAFILFVDFYKAFDTIKHTFLLPSPTIFFNPWKVGLSDEVAAEGGDVISDEDKEEGVTAVIQVAFVGAGSYISLSFSLCLSLSPSVSSTRWIFVQAVFKFLIPDFWGSGHKGTAGLWYTMHAVVASTHSVPWCMLLEVFLLAFLCFE